MFQDFLLAKFEIVPIDMLRVEMARFLKGKMAANCVFGGPVDRTSETRPTDEMAVKAPTADAAVAGRFKELCRVDWRRLSARGVHGKVYQVWSLTNFEENFESSLVSFLAHDFHDGPRQKSAF